MTVHGTFVKCRDGNAMAAFGPGAEIRTPLSVQIYGFTA
jgi:hypothetical protein